MDAHSLRVKVPFADHVALPPRAVIAAFHRWIQHDLLAHETPIDVADYSHVPQGPGVVLVCHEAFYGVAPHAAAAGLTYARRRPANGSPTDRWERALANALDAARMLEQEPALAGRVVFRTDRLELGIDDRLRAPNAAHTLASARAAFEPILARLYGAFRIAHAPDLREPFRVVVDSSDAPTLDVLRGRLTREAPRRLRPGGLS